MRSKTKTNQRQTDALASLLEIKIIDTPIPPCLVVLKMVAGAIVVCFLKMLFECGFLF